MLYKALKDLWDIFCKRSYSPNANTGDSCNKLHTGDSCVTCCYQLLMVLMEVL